MKTLAAVIAVLILAAPARAIELSLEENRAERGSVGFVDMQRLFAASPDAERAKASFEELVRQAEERVNLRKAELLKVRQELDALRAKRETLAKTPVEPLPPAAMPPAAPSPAAAPPPAVSTAPLAAAAPTASTSAPKMLPLALPGMSAASVAPSAPPAVSSTAAVPTPAPAVLPPAPAVVQSTGPTIGQRLLEMDSQILALQSSIAHKEAELTNEHDEADRGLLDVESRRTDQVMARLYRAISEVSRREGVSVVVDKTTILYGHQAVDLTDKVLKYLREQP